MIQPLLDPKQSWAALDSGRHIDPIASESYFNTALKDWLGSASPEDSGGRTRLIHLAEALKRNHGELWLSDFMKAPFSMSATEFLISAVNANYKGDQQKAVRDGGAAASIFKRLRNSPGTALSEYEVVYALRRQSRSRECLQRAPGLLQATRAHSYEWLELQLTMEYSVCEGFVGHFDRASQLASSIAAGAAQANYPSLQLRSLSLVASWDAAEGRFRQSWRSNEEGLSTFWKAASPAERGFQLYSDLELTAEHTELWHLALCLQREVLAMINETGRLDFQATAHLHLATAAAGTGAYAEASEQFSQAEALFAKLSQNQGVKFLRADSEIGLAQLEISRGSTSRARERLLSIGQAISNTTNSLVLLRYKKAWAALARRLADSDQETSALREAVAIADQGYRALTSDRDRWEWNHEVEEPYRRFLELEVEQPHAPAQALADWELYKARQSIGLKGLSGKAAANSAGKQFPQANAKRLKGSSLLTFAVFPQRTIIWMLNDRGIHEAQIPIASEDLKGRIQAFYQLCSDRNSSLEKVKNEGLRLFRMLLEPVTRSMDQGGRLYIEPDRFLGLLPWAALMTEQGYLGEHYSVLEIPNFFYGSRRPIHRNAQIQVLVASPGAVTLEGEHFPTPSHADEEANYLQGLYRKVIHLDKGQVTAKNLRKLLPTVSIFHFAGHAISRENGGELLIHGAVADEFFSWSSLATVKLDKNDLTVLSACSTAAAEGDPVRNPFGLVEAFLASGTHRVLASRWDVDSQSTLIFMKEFYSGLLQNVDPIESTSKGWRALMSSQEWAHPYYWAAFDTFGSAN